MKSIRLFFLIITIAISNTLFAQKANDIIGKYLLPNNLEIEVFKKNNHFVAKITALNNYKNGQTRDVKNSDKSKRKERLLNKIVLTNLIYDSIKKQWINGKMYAPDKGITVNLKITKINGKEVTAIGSKYFFWKTIIWKKTEN